MSAEARDLCASMLAATRGIRFDISAGIVLETMSEYLDDFGIAVASRVEIRRQEIRYPVDVFAQLAAAWAVDARSRVAALELVEPPAFSFIVRQRPQWRAELMLFFTLTSRGDGVPAPSGLRPTDLPAWVRSRGGDQFVSSRRVEYLATLPEARRA